ncbi:hypothetical protein [Streptomyces sp. NPDC096153]|uniref:hypothetical protein n=1 Tax=Streptomyces sp. NPDC096153 TaxID=3155548 RepID=UPI00331DA7DC
MTTDTNGVQDVFVRSMNGIQSSRVSVSRDGVQANAESRHPAISALGNRVAFSSSATNLTLASDTNQKPDVFTRVIADGERTTERVSRSSVGDQANGGSFRPSVNEDGTKVSFQSGATNLTGTPDVNNVSDVFITNISCSPFCTNLVSVGSDGLAADRMSRDSDLTADGKMVLFNSLEQLTAEPDKNEGRFDIYARVLPMSS